MSRPVDRPGLTAAGNPHDRDPKRPEGGLVLQNPRVWLGLVVSAASLGLLLYQVDLHELGTALSGVRYEWLLAAIAIELASLWVRGVRWRMILEESVRVRNSDAFAVLMIGYAANNLLPLRAGELVRAQLMYTQHGTSRLATLGTILVERVFDVLVLAIFVAAPIVALGGDPVLRGTALLLLLAALGATLLLALLALWPGFTTLIVAMLGVLPASIRPKARELLGAFLGGVRALRRPGPWLAVSAASTLTWLLEAGAFWLVGIGCGLTLNPVVYLVLSGAATLVLVAPSTAGGIGLFELSTRAVAGTFGVPLALGTAYALVLHLLVLLFPVVVIGLALLWRRHLGVGAMMSAGQAPAEGAAK
ncbi:MAG: UPF0104 family protein [Chloroflexi bacterium]|nr:MAG: UPF0104 family protein [Chloroflexota bacterium]